MTLLSFNPEPKVLFSEVRIRQRLQEIATQINHEYRGKEVVAIAILKGSFIFFADLIRLLDMPLSCEFMGVSSYGASTVSSGEVKVTLDLTEPVQGKHLLIIEDIVDTGLTMKYILDSLSARKPASLRSVAMLLKPESLKIDLDIDYIGFRIGPEFVIGYGLDYAGRYRQLPYIGVLEHEN